MGPPHPAPRSRPRPCSAKRRSQYARRRREACLQQLRTLRRLQTDGGLRPRLKSAAFARFARTPPATMAARRAATRRRRARLRPRRTRRRRRLRAREYRPCPTPRAPRRRRKLEGRKSGLQEGKDKEWPRRRRRGCPARESRRRRAHGARLQAISHADHETHKTHETLERPWIKGRFVYFVGFVAFANLMAG